MKRLACLLALVSWASAQSITGVGSITGAAGMVLEQSFTLSLSASSCATSAGSFCNLTVTATSNNGFSGTVALTAIPPGPSGVTYGFSPSSVSVPAHGTATSTLTATAASSAPSSSCPGSGNYTVVGTSGTLTQTLSPCVAVTATGNTLTVTVTGGGSVTSSPSGISCPGVCSYVYASGSVTLIETPNAGQTFTGWSGDCSGTGSCSVTMSAPKSVGATFSSTGNAPALPSTFVDNNELTCLITSSCATGSPALTTPYVVPALEIKLGQTTPVSGTIPSYCTALTSDLANGSVNVVTFAGKQLLINDMEACRTVAKDSHSTAEGIILDVPPGTYSSTVGTVIPQSSNTAATAPLIIRSTMDSTLASKPEPVCAGGIEDNLSWAVNPGLINSDCNAGNSGGTFGYQLGTTVTTLPSSGAITLANGTVTSAANYQYLQYMYEDQCSASAPLSCLPFSLCVPYSGTSLTQCTGSTIGPDHWEFMDGAASVAHGNSQNGNLIQTGVSGSPTSATQFAQHIHFRRYWAHGDWTTLLAGTTNTATAIVLASCNYCSVVGTQVSQVLRPGNEGHAILNDSNTGKIVNDWLEGASAGIFRGGFSNAPNITNWVPATDQQEGRLRETWPYSWLGQLTVPAGNTTWGGKSLVRKNCDETKEAERNVRYGIICENVDNSGGQHAITMSLNIRNSSGPGTSVGLNYESTIDNITVEGSIFRNACSGFLIDGRSAGNGSGDGVSWGMTQILLLDNLHYNISYNNYACTSASDYGLYINTANNKWQVSIVENAGGTTATATAICSITGGDCPAGPPSQGYQVFNIRAGEPVAISAVTPGTNCTAFAQLTQTVAGKTVFKGIGPFATIGSPVWTGPGTALTVTYPWVATAGTSDTTGNCVLENGSGNPSYLSIVHQTLITDAPSSLPTVSTLSNGIPFSSYGYYSNSIFTSNYGASYAGWLDSAYGGTTEGNVTEQLSLDYKTLSANYLVFANRVSRSSLYYEYGNNPSSPDPNCSTSTGCNPAPTFFFPTSYCTGGTVNSACVGFLGALSGSLPLSVSDWTQYGLSTSSSYHNTASDGTDMGARVANIKTWMETTTFPGAFPD